MKKLSVLFFSTSLVFVGSFYTVLASATGITYTETVFQKFITEIFNPIFQLGMVITFLYFLYGAAKYMFYLDNEAERTIVKRHLLWGTIGVFIVFSIGGIINLLNGILGGMFS